MSRTSTERPPTLHAGIGGMDESEAAVDDNKSQLEREPMADEALDLPTLKANAPSGRLRRRSERPSNAPGARPAFDADQVPFELSAVPPHLLGADRARRRSDAVRAAVPAEDEYSEAPAKGAEPETMPPSYTTTPAMSVRMEQFEIDERSAISPAERARQRRNGWLHFGAICWTFWLNGQHAYTRHARMPGLTSGRYSGWHDGTTGPLIPTIQRDYKVRCIAPHAGANDLTKLSPDRFHSKLIRRLPGRLHAKHRVPQVVSLIFVLACCGKGDETEQLGWFSPAH